MNDRRDLFHRKEPPIFRRAITARPCRDKQGRQPRTRRGAACTLDRHNGVEKRTNADRIEDCHGRRPPDRTLRRATAAPRMRLLELLSLVAWLVLAGTAVAQPCRPQLLLEPPTPDQWQLEQFAAGQTIRIPFRIEVTTRTGACPFLVGFDLVHSRQVGAHVERRPFSQPLLDIGSSDPRRLLGGETAAEAPTSFDLDLVIAPDPDLSAGRINIQLTQRAYSGADPGSAVQTDRVRERVALDIPATARLIVRSDAGEQALGTGAGFLSLGDLVTGGRGIAALSLAGNVAVAVEVSATRGALVHTEFPEYTVPYSIELGGIRGSGSGALSTRLRPGESVDLEVAVGELETRVAGDYQDTLQITIRTD
jgi:hypothetical protein